MQMPALTRMVRRCLQCGQDALIHDENGKNWGAVLCAVLVFELCGIQWLDAAALVLQKINFTKLDVTRFCMKVPLQEMNWCCIGVSPGVPGVFGCGCTGVVGRCDVHVS